MDEQNAQKSTSQQNPADGFDMEQEVLRQAETVKNAKIEKDFSYFGHCKTLMLQIEQYYRYAFFYTVAVCFLVSFTAMFKQRFQLFSAVAVLFGEPDNFISIFCGGFSQVFIAFAVIVIGYLAWANIRRCNLVLLIFYSAMTLLGLIQRDWSSVALGGGGVVFYARAFQLMLQDERISRLEGYPYFNERFELSKADFEREPWHPDAPDRDAAYMAALTRKTLRGEAEPPKPCTPQKPAQASLDDSKKLAVEEILNDKIVYTPHQEPLPKLEELTLGEEENVKPVQLTKHTAESEKAQPAPDAKSGQTAPADKPAVPAEKKPESSGQGGGQKKRHKKHGGNGHDKH